MGIGRSRPSLRPRFGGLPEEPADRPAHGAILLIGSGLRVRLQKPGISAPAPRFWRESANLCALNGETIWVPARWIISIQYHPSREKVGPTVKLFKLGGRQKHMPITSLCTYCLSLASVPPLPLSIPTPTSFSSSVHS